MAITLYKGISHRALKIETYPQRPTSESLLSTRLLNFPFVRNPLTALNIAGEAAVRDNSMAVIVVARDIEEFIDEAPSSKEAPEGWNYSRFCYPYFSDLKPSQIEILLEGKNILDLAKFVPEDLPVRRIKRVLRDIRRASRRLHKLIPNNYSSNQYDLSLKFI